MFVSKSAIFLSLFTLTSSVLATPPACLLAAVNQQPSPANLTAVCGTNGGKVQQAIASLCGRNVAVAESAFAATCSSAGVTVASYTTSASSTPTNSANGNFVYTTASYDSSCSCTKTVVTSATGAAIPSGFGMTASTVQATTGSATATFSGASGTASAGATGAAAPGAQQAVGSLAAAVVAVAGLVAWL